MISTDKAVNPTSVMGVSKRAAEIYVQALSQRSIVANVRGYSVSGDYSEDALPSRIIDAVATGEIDVEANATTGR